MASASDSPKAEWLSVAERGTVTGIRVVVWVATRLGRRVGRLLLRLIALYYVTFHGSVRRHSRAWLRRVHGRDIRWREVYGHVLRFAQVAMDRIFLIQRRTDIFEFTFDGDHHLRAQHATGKGAILLTAHLGSQAAMSAKDEDRLYKVNVAGYFRNARMINAVFERLDPEGSPRVIHLEPGNAGAVLAIQERIQAGEMVVLAADRVGVNDRHQMVPFMGDPAPFPVGPFLLASVLRCPILMVGAIYREPNRYDLFCERLSDGIDVPRSQRQAAIDAHLRQYVARLEHHARRAPDNWFNFYDFWKAPA